MAHRMKLPFTIAPILNAQISRSLMGHAMVHAWSMMRMDHAVVHAWSTTRLDHAVVHARSMRTDPPSTIASCCGVLPR